MEVVAGQVLGVAAVEVFGVVGRGFWYGQELVAGIVDKRVGIGRMVLSGL